MTIVFKQTILPGSHLEMYDFPFPQSLINDDKYFGEIGMTLVTNPVLDKRFGQEYCRTNIDVSFGTYNIAEDGKIKFKGQVPLECSWDEKFEKSRIENGFKWSPIKSYYRTMKRGISKADGWKIRIDLTGRSGLALKPQEFVLLITIKGAEDSDIYSELVNGLREKGFVTTDLETRYQLRQRQ